MTNGGARQTTGKCGDKCEHERDKVYGMSRDHYKSIHSREVAMVAFGWFMRMVDGEEYEGFEYVGIFDWCVLDPPPPVVTDEWVDLYMGW